MIKNYVDHVVMVEMSERWDTYHNPKEKAGKNPCDFLWGEMYVWYDGKCNPCDVDYKSELLVGNIIASKLLEKYNDLAKEALTSGDKILSESYYQHADHFLRVVENQNSIQNNPKPYLDNSSIEKNSDNKIIIKDEKNSSSQQSQNIEEI